MGAAGELMAHGVGNSEDLPIPLSYALTGAALALVVSFLALGLLWREPKLRPESAGWALPVGLTRVIDGRPVRVGLRVLGVALTAYVLMAAWFGRDDALNPTAGSVYVLLWVGVPLLSALLGPVWSLLNPLRALHRGLSYVTGTSPQQGLAPYPRALGYWPAAATLLVFVWLELVAPENTSLRTLRTFVAGNTAAHLLGATYYGSRWFARGDGFEVFSSLAARLAPLGRRRSDRRLVLRDPVSGVAGTPGVPGLVGVVGVLLGSTLFDSFSSGPWWIVHVQESSLSPRVLNSLALLAMVLIVTGLFVVAAAITGRLAAVSADDSAETFAHTLIPIVVGYVVAHYWSLLMVIGQQTLLQLSDPLGTGADWFGVSGLTIWRYPAQPGFVSVLQVSAVILGHVLAVVLAHDRAVRMLPAGRVVIGQLPMLVLMVVYTVGGLSLLFAS